MKKLLAMVATTSLTLAGVAIATIPANAAVGGTPSFATSSFTVAPGDAFDETLSPTFGGNPSWYYGSRASLNIESCGDLPPGLSYVQEGIENSNGIAPTYEIAGTVDPMAPLGDYTVCFYTESNPEGTWDSYGTSQAVTITVADTGGGIPAGGGSGSIGQTSASLEASQATLVKGQSVTITPSNAPEGAWVAWFIEGVYVTSAPVTDFPQTIAYSDLTPDNPSVDNTVTWALYEGIPPMEPSLSDTILASTNVEWLVSTMAFTNSGSFASGEAWSQEATFTQAGFDFSDGGDFALAGGAVLPEGITFTPGFAGGVPTLSFSGNASVYGDFTTDFVLSDRFGNSATATYSFTIAQSHTNETDGEKVCAIFPQAVSDFSTATVTFEGVCSSDGTIDDAYLTNAGDAYDFFGNVIGYNENGTEFLITSDDTVVEGNTITFTDYHVWSATAEEWVDVVVTRTFTGNTVTWDVQVFSAETINPSTLQISISGNLGSDEESVFTSFESGILGSNDGYYGDPELLWNSYGATQEYADGIDEVFFHYGTTGHAVLQNTLIDYEACPDVPAIEAYTATVANDWETYANTDLTAVTGLVCLAVSPSDFSGTVGVPMEVTLDITTADSYDFSEGAWDDAWGLPDGLSYTVVYDEVTGAPTQIVISGTPTADGAGSMSLEIWDDYDMDNTILIPFSIEAAAVTSSFEVNGATFQATVNSSSDLTPSNTVGFDFAEGGNIVVSGLPVGISYVVNNAGVAGVIPTVTLSGATETESDYTIVVTLTDNFGNEASMFPTVTVTAAPAPAPVTPTFTVGGDVAFMADIESDTTLTIVDDSGLDWTNGGTIVVTGLPAGLSYSVLNANTPGVKPSVRIYGTATTVGEYVISLTVTDSNDNTAEANSATEIIKASTSADLGLEVAVGGVVAGSESFYVADGLLVGANWTLTVRSTPQVIASGTVPVNGAIGGLATIPSGLEAGWHSLTLVSTDYAGNPVSKVVWFEISANGTLVATSNTEPSVLAYTGSNIALAAGGAFALLIAGAGVMLVARRRKVEAN